MKQEIFYEVAIVDTGGANHASLQHAFQRLGVIAPVLSDLEQLEKANRWILPGVGHGGFAINRLQSLGLDQAIKLTKKNVFGICLGMQLLFSDLDEGSTQGLGLLPGRVSELEPAPDFRVPHMGWNQVIALKPSKLLQGVDLSSSFYFTHSFACPDSIATVAKTVSPREIASVLEYKNYFATQFHPEKSSDSGLQVLRNFLDLPSQFDTFQVGANL